MAYKRQFSFHGISFCGPNTFISSDLTAPCTNVVSNFILMVLAFVSISTRIPVDDVSVINVVSTPCFMQVWTTVHGVKHAASMSACVLYWHLRISEHAPIGCSGCWMLIIMTNTRKLSATDCRSRPGTAVGSSAARWGSLAGRARPPSPGHEASPTYYCQITRMMVATTAVNYGAPEGSERAKRIELAINNSQDKDSTATSIGLCPLNTSTWLNF